FFVIFPRRTPATGPSLWVCERTDHGTNSTDPIWGRARGGCHPASHLRRCRLPWPRRPAGAFFTSRESKGSAPAHWRVLPRPVFWNGAQNPEEPNTPFRFYSGRNAVSGS